MKNSLSYEVVYSEENVNGGTWGHPNLAVSHLLPLPLLESQQRAYFLRDRDRTYLEALSGAAGFPVADLITRPIFWT